MTDTNSTTEAPVRKPRKRKPKKPAKPYPDFPLFPHATKRWAKKIKGRLHYFGPWADPQAALQRYLDQRDDLHAGRAPRTATDGFTIADLLNKFLTFKLAKLEKNKLSPQSYAEYYATCKRMADTFGKNRLVSDLRPIDFQKYRMKIEENWGPVRQGNEIIRVRSILKHGRDNGYIEKPILYGTEFEKPSKQELRKHRAKSGKRMFEADEIRAMLKTAGVQLRAMFLLAANCGFGNNDVASLTITALDLERGWVNFARPKTGIDRRAKLWPETVTAIREAMAKRPKPKDEADAGILFLTQRGARWVTVKTEKQPDEKVKVKFDNSVSKETKKVLKKLDINGRRNFYALRHTFETIGGDARDQVAVNAIMGHVDESMAATYRERISDERLAAVAEHVRGWLFGAEVQPV
jgi:integrase